MSEKEIIEILNEEQLEQVLQDEVPTLVDFWAPWCGPCKAMLPILSAVASHSEYSEKVKIVKVNIDNLPNVAAKYNIRGIPHCILFKQKEQLGSLIGLQPQRALEDFLKQHLSN